MIFEYLKVNGTDGSVLDFSEISKVDLKMTTYSRSARNGATISSRGRRLTIKIWNNCISVCFNKSEQLKSSLSSVHPCQCSKSGTTETALDSKRRRSFSCNRKLVRSMYLLRGGNFGMKHDPEEKREPKIKVALLSFLCFPRCLCG